MFVIFLLIHNVIFSQRISGTWVGTYEKNLPAEIPEEPVVEIFIYNDSLITGGSHLYYKIVTYGHCKIKGLYSKNNSTVYFSEDSTIAVTPEPMIDDCPGNYTMQPSTTNTTLRLAGKRKDNSTALFHCLTTGAWPEKQKEAKQIGVLKSNTNSPDHNPDKNPERNMDIQSLAEVCKNETDPIEAEIFDNGIIDSDTVSVYFNDSLIVSNKMIPQKKLTFLFTWIKANPTK